MFPLLIQRLLHPVGRNRKGQAGVQVRIDKGLGLRRRVVQLGRRIKADGVHNAQKRPLLVCAYLIQEGMQRYIDRLAVVDGVVLKPIHGAPLTGAVEI